MTSWPCEVCRQPFPTRQQLEQHTITVHLSAGGAPAYGNTTAPPPAYGAAPPAYGNPPPAYAPHPGASPVAASAAPAYGGYAPAQPQSPQYAGYAPQQPPQAQPQHYQQPIAVAPVRPAAAAAPPSYTEMTSQLPPGWEKIIDPTSGRPVYVNHVTKETSWNPPQPVGAPMMAGMPSPPPQQQVVVSPVVPIVYGNVHPLAPLGMVDSVAVPVAAGTNGVPYNNSFVFAPTATGPEIRPPTGAPPEQWTPPAWFRNTTGYSRKKGERPPPPHLIVPGGRGTGTEVGGTHFYHCFDRCNTFTFMKAIFFRDNHSWHSANICVPRAGNITCGDACMDCCDHRETDFNNPGSCCGCGYTWCTILGFPVRLVYSALFLPAMAVFMVMDLLLWLFSALFWMCGSQKCLNPEVWCSWSFGVIDKEDRGTRFKFAENPVWAWLGCLKIWFCYVTSRQRHYSYLSCIRDPKDNAYLALRVRDDPPQ